MDSRQERKNLAQRRELGRTLGVVAVSGVLLLVGFEIWLRHLAARSVDDPEAALRTLSMVSTLLMLASAACAALLGRYLMDWARQARSQKQWPPAGLELPGGAPLRYGADALRMARGLQAAGIVCLVLALSLVLAVAWRWLA